MWAEAFVPLRTLGVGDTATLVLCSRISAPNELVVVKELRTPASVTNDRVLQQELEVAAWLLKVGGHRHIVAFEALYTPPTGDHVALVMEYCADGDLFSLLERQSERRMDESRALHFFRQATLGVQFLHAHGIAHRDLSLENLLLTQDASELKICDFGLSTSVHTQSCGRVGKFNYMAPEVVDGSPYCPAQADIWSLGVVLFVLLTDSPLCEIAEPLDPAFNALQQVGVGGILAHWELKHLFSHDTVALLSDLLQPNPLQRIASADNILVRLDRFAQPRQK